MQQGLLKVDNSGGRLNRQILQDLGGHVRRDGVFDGVIRGLECDNVHTIMTLLTPQECLHKMSVYHTEFRWFVC